MTNGGKLYNTSAANRQKRKRRAITKQIYLVIISDTFYVFLVRGTMSLAMKMKQGCVSTFSGFYQFIKETFIL